MLFDPQSAGLPLEPWLFQQLVLTDWDTYQDRAAAPVGTSERDRNPQSRPGETETNTSGLTVLSCSPARAGCLGGTSATDRNPQRLGETENSGYSVASFFGRHVKQH